MKRHRLLTLAGAGSAAAAALIAWSVLFAPTPGATVEAATVFASFKDALGSAFRVTFNDIGAEGLRADGQVVVMYDSDQGAAAAFESAPSALYVEAHVRADASAEEDLVGMDLQAAVSIMEGNEWVFVQATSLPTKIVEEQPMALVFAQMAKDGLLLDLDGMLTEEVLSDAIIGGPPHVAGRRHRAHADIDTDADADPDEDEAEVDVHENAEVAIRIGNGGPPEPHSGNAVSIKGDSASGGEADLDIELTGMPDVDQALSDLLTGKATADDFQALAALIEEAASNVSVDEEEPGLHVLRASGFHFEDDAEAEELLGKAILRVAYREGAGLAWATVEHVGRFDGTVRFELTDVTAEDPMFDRERFMEDERVKRFNLSQLAGMFGATDD
ncbi:MAG: hypothetical protein GY778_21710 [bacterium]|nr:hypothetical protein [bacterium]